MSEFQLFQRLEAFKLGRAINRTEKLTVQRAADNEVLSVAFVRMGGESVPWGIAFKSPNTQPEYFICPDPRKRTELAQTIKEFGERFIPKFNQILSYTSPQIWLPNSSHLDMLHFIALRYLWTKHDIPGEEIPGRSSSKLREVGRLANFLFYISQREGQTLVNISTDVLRSMYTYPADDLRQAHLGFLLAWHNHSNDYTENLKSASKS